MLAAFQCSSLCIPAFSFSSACCNKTHDNKTTYNTGFKLKAVQSFAETSMLKILWYFTPTTCIADSSDMS